MRILLGLIMVVLIVLAACSSVYTVDRTEFAYVTQFGRHVATHDGESDAGLHFKLPWPVQSVQRLDHRLQFFDLPATELPTRDAEGKTVDKMLTIVAYVCWQIPNGESVDQFIRTVGTPERAREILGQRIRSRLGAEIGSMHLDDLISIAPARESQQRMDRLQKRLLGSGPPEASRSRLPGQTLDLPVADKGDAGLKNLARSAYGIDILDIRLRRYNYPQQVHDAIFQRIRSERSKKVAEFESEGKTRAAKITSTAEREASDIVTEARSDEERIKQDADIKAKDILTQAHSKDWQFFFFLENLKNGQNILGATKDVLVLSSKSPIFDFLFKPPQMHGAAPQMPGPAPAAAPTALTNKPAKGQ